MRRAFVFLLLGPLVVAVIGAAPIMAAFRVADSQMMALMVAAIFVVSLPAWAVVGLIDSLLAHHFTTPQRVGLTAAAGAIVPCALLGLVAHGAVPSPILLPLAICGAVATSLCALLAGSPGSQAMQGYAAALQARSGVS